MEEKKIVSTLQHREKTNRKCQLEIACLKDDKVIPVPKNTSDKSGTSDKDCRNCLKPELSKSKKRRLRKRHQLSSQSPQESVNLIFNLELEPNQLPQNSLSANKTCPYEKEIVNNSAHDEVNTNVASDCLKQETGPITNNDYCVPQPLKITELVESNKSETVCDTFEVSIENKTMSSNKKPEVGIQQEEGEKSRNEVLAEREARKQAKLAAKNKKKSSGARPNNESQDTSAETHRSYDVPDGAIERISRPVVVNRSDLSSEKQPPGKKDKEGKKIVENLGKGDTSLDLTCGDSGKKESGKTVKSTEPLGVRKENNANKVEVKKLQTDSSVEIVDRITKTEQPQSADGTTGDQKTKGGEQKSTEIKAGEKSKAELRAERRAKQEAQRAAKTAEKQQKTAAAATKSEDKPKEKKQLDVEPTVAVIKKKELNKEKKTDSTMNSLRLFSHLHYDTKPPSTLVTSSVHPAIVELGVKYTSRVICGSNARCVAFLQALKKVINDYTTPREKEFSRGLEAQLGPATVYLNKCRPLSVSMINALRHLKSHLNQLANDIQDSVAKSRLCEAIDTYIKDQIHTAAEAISSSVMEKIANGDVILIYACSSLLYEILVKSHRKGTKFSVVIVDSAPLFEGREMLRRLVLEGLKCTYVLINAISFIMRQATKVLLGAHALLANGYVMSRAGCALVALVAHWNNVPVLVCCETYKFCERVQTDAFVFNELGSMEDIAPPNSTLANYKNLAHLSPLSILYDVTPPDLVTAVVTEVAILPCTSVPVILRVKPSDVAT